MPRKGIRYTLVELNHPVIENLFTKLNVMYGGKSDLNMSSPRSQVINRDCQYDICWACDCDTQVDEVVHPVEDARPD